MSSSSSEASPEEAEEGPVEVQDEPERGEEERELDDMKKLQKQVPKGHQRAAKKAHTQQGRGKGKQHKQD